MYEAVSSQSHVESLIQLFTVHNFFQLSQQTVFTSLISHLYLHLILLSVVY